MLLNFLFGNLSFPPQIQSGSIIGLYAPLDTIYGPIPHYYAFLCIIRRLNTASTTGHDAGPCTDRLNSSPLGRSRRAGTTWHETRETTTAKISTVDCLPACPPARLPVWSPCMSCHPGHYCRPEIFHGATLHAETLSHAEAAQITPLYRCPR